MPIDTVDWHPATGYGIPGDRNKDRTEWHGLTKREYFALHFAAAYMGADCVGNSGYPAEDIAKRGVEAADALIESLNKKKT